MKTKMLRCDNAVCLAIYVPPLLTYSGIQSLLVTVTTVSRSLIKSFDVRDAPTSPDFGHVDWCQNTVDEEGEEWEGDRTPPVWGRNLRPC